MTTYKRVKPATSVPVADTYLELKMPCLFYFALKSEKNGHNAGLQWYLKNDSIFPLFILFYIFSILIPNVQFIPQFINVIATNNDLLTNVLNMIYFAPKLWLYNMIWLPQTTDNSTYFAQSLETGGIESRL